MERELLIEVLLRWNIWGRRTFRESLKREKLEEAMNLLSSKRTLLIIGPRRAGKTTLMEQMMKELSGKYNPKRFLYINFEDYALSSQKLSSQILEDIVQVYTEEVYPGEGVFLFLDEIQNVEGWHRWVRNALELGRFSAVVISGSSSKLLSGELSSLLTGRHLDILVLPFSFREYLEYFKVLPKDRLKARSNLPALNNYLKSYVNFGGFPEIVTISDESQKYFLLSQYAQDMVLKDVALRKGVKNVEFLKWLASFLAKNISRKVSIRSLQKLYKAFLGGKSSVSTTTVSNYISFLEEAYIVFRCRKFSFSEKEALLSPFKIYMVDPGLRNAMYPSRTPDFGHLLENMVFLHILPFCERISYFEERGEIDFVCEKNGEYILLNVTAATSEKELSDRELRSFDEFPIRSSRCFIITWNLHGKLRTKNCPIEIIPAAEFFLSEW